MVNIYVSPNGGGDGSELSPCSLEQVQEKVQILKHNSQKKPEENLWEHKQMREFLNELATFVVSAGAIKLGVLSNAKAKDNEISK